MLAAYYIHGPDTGPADNETWPLLRQLGVQLARSSIARSRLWLERSKTRESCDDAYGDLILATLEFGSARPQAEAIEALPLRFALIGEINQLMTELLEWSHALRVHCRMPLRRGPANSMPATHSELTR